jgi:hypothetical protein
VPSTQMRCMITANRRARATIAFFIPRSLAICKIDCRPLAALEPPFSTFRCQTIYRCEPKRVMRSLLVIDMETIFVHGSY